MAKQVIKISIFSELQSPIQLVLRDYWSYRTARADLWCKEKEAEDVRHYPICDLYRGPVTVRRILLASDAGRSCGAAGLRPPPGGCRRAKWPTHRPGLPGFAGPSRSDPGTAFWRQWSRTCAPLLRAGGWHRLAARTQHACGCRLERARTSCLRVLRCGADRPPAANQSRAGRVNALLLSGYF